MKIYQKILVPVDLTPGSNKTLEKAKALAENFAAKITIIHALEPIPFYGFGYVDVHQLEKQLLDSATSELRKLGDNFQIPVADQHLQIAFPKQYILEMYEKLKPDLVVIGSQSKGNALTRLGSTADYIAHHVACDVIIVRHESVNT